KNGTQFLIVEFMPTPASVQSLPMDTMMKVVGADAPKRGMPPRHPLMHRTRSVDYAIIMSGEITMLLDDGEVKFRAGDVLVQQATNHAWVDRGTEPCRGLHFDGCERTVVGVSGLSAHGASRTCRHVRSMSALGGKADSIYSV